MAAPVWVLSVDLQTKTATFQSGMADAAKAARGSFSDIKNAAKDMDEGVRGASSGASYSMGEARHSVMMLGEEFGVHLPRGITMFISSLGPVGAALEAAFPFMAIILGATLLIEHLAKVDEAAKKAGESQTKAFDAATKSLDEAQAKGLELKIKLAELVGGPTTDLENKLRNVKDLLASMKLSPELKNEFEELAKGIQVGSKWNPLNWLNDSVAVSKEVKSEAQSAGLAISGAVSVEEKRATAYRELTKAQLELSDIQKKGNSQSIEDQQALIRLLQTTAQNLDHQVENQNTEHKVQDADKAAKAAREQDAIAKAQQAGLDHRQKVEAEYAKKTTEERKEATEAAEKDAEGTQRAWEGYYKWAAEQEKERAHLVAEMGKESAEHAKKMADLQIEADVEAGTLQLGRHRENAQAIANLEIQAEIDRYNAQQAGYAAELAALDKFGKDYAAKKQQIEDRMAEAERASQNKIVKIDDDAEKEKDAKLKAAYDRMESEIAGGLARVLTGHETFAKMVTSLGDQVAQGMLENAMKSMMAMDMDKEKQAAHAARDGYLAGMKFPFPVNLVMAPSLAAMAFASMMAFEEGGIVPGVGRGDVTPAMLTPGESVLPKQLTEGLTRAAEGGSMGGDTHVHVHHHAVYNVQAFDSAGVDKVLQQHGEKFVDHAARELRRRNM
jgi:hypothetical protein